MLVSGGNAGQVVFALVATSVDVHAVEIAFRLVMRERRQGIEQDGQRLWLHRIVVRAEVAVADDEQFGRTFAMLLVELAANGAGGLGTVSTQIGEALIETALGLAVAIPAVIFFNYLTGRVSAVESALGRSSGQLIDEMEFQHAHPEQLRDSGDVETRAAA